MMLLAGVAFVVPGAGQPGLMAIGGICIALAVVELAMVVGLWRLRGYGRTLLLVFSSLGLLAIPIGSVRSRIHRARATLRELLTDVRETLDGGDEEVAHTTDGDTTTGAPESDG